MLQKHITIEELTNIQIYRNLKINPYKCSQLMKIGKDKVYHYYKLFKEGFTVLEIYNMYKENKRKCGRKKCVFSEDKTSKVRELLKGDWSIDAICGRDKLLEAEEKCSTKTLYRMTQDGFFDIKLLRRKGKRKPNNHKETRGKINDCKTLDERDQKYPLLTTYGEFGHFEGDTIIGEKRRSAIVTLVERTTKYIVLLKASRKSEDVLNTINNWLLGAYKETIKTVTFDRGKEFAKWKEMEDTESLEVFFSDPGSPGQRGLNENSNGIVRKDLPKSTDLSKYSQRELNQIAKKWNSIPRKSLGYLAPEEVVKIAVGVKSLLPTAKY